ncbi:ABC transporter ATP-binding protein [Dictyobacter arantiisoli]|uniref:Helicase n=1 Tax=Dictyobacter arantiisoli TaxID=2014874 RepID=A0A5A5T9X8_9CHLR|nr:ABC transporter ATP-binding protein [Dictyobacter arantiisoli]GCF08065.1 helicase [Dictyobacter arantiisoli]
MRIPFREYKDLLLRYLSPQRMQVLLLGSLLCAEIALQLIDPQFLRIFIDTITSVGPQPSLMGIAALFIGIAIAQQLVTVGATYISERVGWKATNALRADLALHLIRMDMSFHKVHTPGELIERVDGDVNELANFFARFVTKILGGTLLLLGILIILWSIEWHVGLALTIFALITLFGITSTRGLATQPWKVYRQVTADLFGFLEERLRGTEDIRANGARSYVLRRLFMLTRQRLETGKRARLISSIPWSLPTFFFAMAYIIAFVLIAWLYPARIISIGTAFLIYYYTQLLAQPIMLISHQLDDFQKATASIARIGELLNTPRYITDGPGAILPAGPLSVSFEGVEFGYGETDMILKNISFEMKPGEVMGILGRTGSGKTTLTRLLFRLYDPAAGCIYLGGQPIKQAGVADLRRHIGIVTQEVQLFHATVRDNLTLFDHSIADSLIHQALADMGLTGWYEKLEQGLDTMLAANGGGLSAGEAQLLAFTRVFLRDPGLIILDEASSRLDPATEHLIETAMDKLLSNRTGIIIAHRLGTIKRVDTILIMENGEISEYGPQQELLAKQHSRYAALLRTANEEVLA